jgi:cell division protein FtsW (lipid II flippase)
MSRHFLFRKNRSLIRYLLIVLVFVLLAFGVYLFFKFRIKIMERENDRGFHVTNKIIVEYRKF